METRLIGALNAHTGAVQAFSCSQLSRERLVEFYQQVTQAYPGVQTIWMVQDNWSLHFHPDVLVALEAQQSPFPFSVPSNWPKVPSPAAKKRYETWHLPLQLVQLPTYSPWLNPIEKLWRKLKQEFIYLHRRAEDPKGLQQQVLDFLHQFRAGSTDLLRYVGLLPKESKERAA